MISHAILKVFDSVRGPRRAAALFPYYHHPFLHSPSFSPTMSDAVLHESITLVIVACVIMWGIVKFSTLIFSALERAHERSLAARHGRRGTVEMARMESGASTGQPEHSNTGTLRHLSLYRFRSDTLSILAPAPKHVRLAPVPCTASDTL